METVKIVSYDAELDETSTYGFVLIRVAVTPNEARRRLEENATMHSALADLEARLRAWALLTPARKAIDGELDRRISFMSDRLLESGSAASAAEVAVSQAEAEADDAEQRRRSFLADKAIHIHELTSEAEADALVAQATAAVEAAKSRRASVKATSAGLMGRLRMKKKARRAEAMDDLKQKYAYLLIAERLEILRNEARENGWRRPSDGEDGADYAAWSHRRELGDAAPVKVPGSDEIPEPAGISWLEDAKAEGDEIASRYDFDDTDEMRSWTLLQVPSADRWRRWCHPQRGGREFPLV